MKEREKIKQIKEELKEPNVRLKQKRWINVKRHRIDYSYKIYFKKNGCTMLLFKNLTLWRAIHRKKVLMNQYEDWQGHFIVTK